jgi:ubiquitin-like-conjugating enzyme ATG10
MARTLTAQNHPLTDRPAYFVHPCNTADAMKDICADREGGEVGVEEYLVLWLGLVGGAVGVWVPGSVAAEGDRRGSGDG